MKPDWTGGKQAQTYYRLAELEVLCVSGDTESTSVFINDAVLGLLLWRKDTSIYHTLENPVQLLGHRWCLKDLRFRGAWSGGFRGHETICTSEMHGSTAEICSPGAFGGVIQKCEEACLFGGRDEVMMDRQAWY